MVSISYYLIMYTKLTAALIGAKLTVLTFGLSREARSSSLREYFSWRYKYEAIAIGDATTEEIAVVTFIVEL